MAESSRSRVSGFGDLSWFAAEWVLLGVFGVGLAGGGVCELLAEKALGRECVDDVREKHERIERAWILYDVGFVGHSFSPVVKDGFTAESGHHCGGAWSFLSSGSRM